MKKIKSGKLSNTLIALLVMLLWGSLFPMVKLGYVAFDVSETGDILLFAGLRFAICGFFICASCFEKDKSKFLPVKESILPILASGVFAIILHYGFTYIGLSLTDSSKTSILKQVGVLFYVCFSALFFKEDKLTVNKAVGVILGFIGILAINANSGGGFSFHLGDVLIIGASFCTVFSNIISKKVYMKVDPVVTTGVSQLFGGIVLIAVGLIMGGGISIATPAALPVMLYICGASVISYSLWSIAVNGENLSYLFIIKFSEPIFTAICGMLILGEDIMKWQYLVAFLLITFGILVTAIPTKRKDNT